MTATIANRGFTYFFGTLPPWSNDSSWRLAVLEIFDESVALVHDHSLLLNRHGRRIFMRVAMQTDLMALISDHSTLLWESFQTVPWNEKGRLDVVFGKHLEQTTDSNGSSKETSGDVTSRVLTTVGPQPASNSVDIDGDAALYSCSSLVYRECSHELGIHTLFRHVDRCSMGRLRRS